MNEMEPVTLEGYKSLLESEHQEQKKLANDKYGNDKLNRYTIEFYNFITKFIKGREVGVEGIELDEKEENDVEIFFKQTLSGGSSRKARPVSSARVTPVKTNRTYKGRDGVERKLYKKGTDFYVKKKSEKTGKFTYRKVKVLQCDNSGTCIFIFFEHHL